MLTSDIMSQNNSARQATLSVQWGTLEPLKHLTAGSQCIVSILAQNQSKGQFQFQNMVTISIYV